MPTVNHGKKELFLKIVYYGPALCGKTTNLEFILARTPEKHRGAIASLNTESDRTLFFDYLPVNVGIVGGYKTRVQLFTVPGQVFYNQTRRLVLKNVDGLVFVCDSQAALMNANRESMESLAENLQDPHGLDLAKIPLVMQWNKQDLPGLASDEDLQSLNSYGAPVFKSVATLGTGVFETLHAITQLSLRHVRDNSDHLPPDTKSDVMGMDLDENDL